MDLPKLIFEEKFDQAKSIIAKGNIDLNRKNDNNNTPLLAAIDTDNIAFIEFLIRHGADVNYLVKGVDLPLNYAIETSVEAEDYLPDVTVLNTDIIQLLLAHGADIMKPDNFGNTPFEFAQNYHLPAQALFEKMKTDKQ